nr:10315_t:CDS:2 [Entrophospora candida]
MPKLKRKIKLCKELAAAKKTKTSNKNNLVNIEAFNNDSDVENLGVEELSNNVVKGDSSNEVGGYLEIEIDEDFEWFDNEIEKNAESLYDVLSNNIENVIPSSSLSNRPLVYLVDEEVNHEKENYSSLAINKIELKLKFDVLE